MTRESKKERETERQGALEHLREALPPGSKVYTSVYHVSRSGMYRLIRVYMASDGTIVDITGWVARAVGLKMDHKRRGIGMSGCGTDMGFQVVYLLGRILYPDGGPLESSVREYQERRAGAAKEKNGGYLLKHNDL